MCDVEVTEIYYFYYYTNIPPTWDTTITKMSICFAAKKKIRSVFLWNVFRKYGRIRIKLHFLFNHLIW